MIPVLVKISPDRGEIRLVGGHPAGRDELHRLVRSWPGWKRCGSIQVGSQRASRYKAPLTPSTAPPLLSTQALDVRWEDPRDRLTIEGFASRPILAKEALEGDLPELPDLGLLRPLMEHQQRAVAAFAALGGRMLLADDMGLGKTTTALACVKHSGVQRALVICPASVKWNWDREARSVLGESTRVWMIDGTPLRRRSVLAGMRHVVDSKEEPVDGGPPFLAVINYDLLPFLDDADRDTLAEWVHMQALVCDESHYLKSDAARRTKFVRRWIAPKAGPIILMTGTPIRNMVDDLFTQVEILRPGTWASRTDFESRHIVMSRMAVAGGREVRKPIRAKGLDELNAVMNTIQVKRRKEDLGGLPPKIYTYTEIELDRGSRAVYDRMKEMAILELSKLADDVGVFKPQAQSGVEAALRCEQIAQGFVGGIPPEYLERVSKHIAEHCEKITGRTGELVFRSGAKLSYVRESAEAVVSQGGAPVIFSRFLSPLFWLHQQFPDYGLVHGGVDSKARQKIFDDFLSGRLSGVLCQVSIAEGFNLTRSQDVIFLGRDWSPAINAQAEARAHRIGSTGTVNIQIPIVRDTIEQRIHERLQGKAEDAERALRNLTIGDLKEML